jgi:hypothetical protein
MLAMITNNFFNILEAFKQLKEAWSVVFLGAICACYSGI